MFALFVLEDGLADADALVADIGTRIVGRRRNELFDLFLRLVAERATQRLVWAIFFHV